MREQQGVDAARQSKRAAMRKVMLQLVVGVVVLDVLAMLAYHYAGIETGPPRTRTMFTTVWIFVTAGVVVLQLRRMRRVRFARY